jgi:hypothetical protein
LELRASGSSVRWKASVTFAEEPLALLHLGCEVSWSFSTRRFVDPRVKCSSYRVPTCPWRDSECPV